ncbi:MAG: Lactamase protein [Dehalococcoidia bacterium]|nr:Lactamase protein [Dehalococcoidia bacterium]
MIKETISVPFRKSIHPHLEGVEVIREGDTSGNDTVLRFILQGGREVSAIALPQSNDQSRTGPTWTYLVDCQGWSLIDAGPRGALEALERGLGTLGRKLTDLERVIITHGHQDHDGNAYDLVKASGAQLWAHEMYFPFLTHDYQHMGLDRTSPLHQGMGRFARDEGERYGRHQDPSTAAHWHGHNREYMGGHRRILEEKLPIHGLRDGELIGDMRFLYTPGHAVDAMSIGFGGAVFTGDHILPQITPHPTFQQAYPESLLAAIPPEHQQSKEHYGLACYLRSLGKVLDLGMGITVLPAHRLFNHGRLNLRNLQRAQEIVRHHMRRLESIMEGIGEDAATLGEVTVRSFPSRKLAGGGYFAAMSEVISHLELLADIGDIQVSEDGRVRRSDTETFRQEVEALVAHASGWA